jgi:hypothetical protein
MPFTIWYALDSSLRSAPFGMTEGVRLVRNDVGVKVVCNDVGIKVVRNDMQVSLGTVKRV